MFEAIIRTKIIYLEKSELFSFDENAFQNIIHLQKDISEENFKNVCESKDFTKANKSLIVLSRIISCYGHFTVEYNSRSAYRKLERISSEY